MTKWTDQTIERKAQLSHLLVDLIEAGLAIVEFSKVAFEHDTLTGRDNLPGSADDLQLVPLHIDLDEDRLGKSGRIEEVIESRLLDANLLLQRSVGPGLEMRGPHGLK